MRKILLLLIVLFVVFVVVYRDRLFLRDPIAKLERKGVAQTGEAVYINFSNDILVQENSGKRMFVVQHRDRLPHMPAGLTCFQGLACLTPENSSLAESSAVANGHLATMTDRVVTFTDDDGVSVRVQIR